MAGEGAGRRRGRAPALELRGLRFGLQGAPVEALPLSGGRVVQAPVAGARVLELGGRLLLPGLVNAHDHLDQSLFLPPPGAPFEDGYAWIAALEADAPRQQGALRVPVVELLFLGGLRNLLCGVTAVVHHGADHRALGDDEFPVRVQRRYEFAHSPGQTLALRRSYRTSDRRIPWFVHAGEGRSARVAGELHALAAANVLRQNTVIARGLAFGATDAQRLAEARACLVWCPEADRAQYQAVADLRGWRAAGVRVGLGSDSSPCGARDLLSTVAHARGLGLLDDASLIELASAGSAEVARLPVGGLAPGDPADFVAVEDLEAFLRGEREALALVVVGGRPLCGRSELLEAAGLGAVPCGPLALERGLHERARRALRGLGPERPAWLSGLTF